MKSKEELVKIYEQVMEDLKNGDYENKFGDYVEFNDRKLKTGSKLYQEDDIVNVSYSPRFDNTKIYVQNIDSFLKAIELGKGVAVLNMASQRNPGGGVAKGSRAQEEDLCRRSNLLMSLYSFTKKGEMLGYVRKDERYPIPTYGGIYSPGVEIYRDQNYKTYENSFKVDIISVAAMVSPEFDPVTLMISKKQAHIMKRKIKTILRIALMNKKTKLVLGAFGCGAFCNPPKHVALMFKEVLDSGEFKNAFEEICFAILDDSNTGKEHNPEGNYKPFVDVFGDECSK